MYTYTYIITYVHIHIYIYIYLCIEREREREIDRQTVVHAQVPARVRGARLVGPPFYIINVFVTISNIYIYIYIYIC